MTHQKDGNQNFLVTTRLATKIYFQTPIIMEAPKCEQRFSYICLDGRNRCIKTNIIVTPNAKWACHISFDNHDRPYNASKLIIQCKYELKIEFKRFSPYIGAYSMRHPPMSMIKPLV